MYSWTELYLRKFLHEYNYIHILVRLDFLVTWFKLTVTAWLSMKIPLFYKIWENKLSLKNVTDFPFSLLVLCSLLQNIRTKDNKYNRERYLYCLIQYQSKRWTHSIWVTCYQKLGLDLWLFFENGCFLI